MAPTYRLVHTAGRIIVGQITKFILFLEILSSPKHNLMVTKTIMQFEANNTPVFIETDQAPDFPKGGFIAANGGQTVLQATRSLHQSLDPVMGFVQAFMNRIDSLPTEKPTSIELEIGLKLGAEISCWVITGQGEGNINLKLSWETK